MNFFCDCHKLISYLSFLRSDDLESQESQEKHITQNKLPYYSDPYCDHSSINPIKITIERQSGKETRVNSYQNPEILDQPVSVGDDFDFDEIYNCSPPPRLENEHTSPTTSGFHHTISQEGSNSWENISQISQLDY